MKIKFNFYTRLLAFAMLMPLFANAQEKFPIAGGGGAKQGSVYSEVLGDLAGQCSTDQFQLSEVNTNGGVTNLAMLLENKVKAALVPTSLLYNAKSENASSVANIKVLVGLHPEAVHLLARADTKEEGGFGLGKLKIGTDKITFNQPEDLKNRNVGAVGGSVVDAQILGDKLRIGWKVKPYEKNTDLLAAFAAHEIDAIVIVAGKGSKAVAALKGDFKLLPVRGSSDTAEVYKPMKVQYPSLNGGRAVDTLSTQALLVTRKWSQPETNASLASLRQCFNQNLGKIKDTVGTNAVWQDVPEGDVGTWPMYEFPKQAAAVEAVVPAKSAKK